MRRVIGGFSFKEGIAIALKALTSSRLRSILTIAIISIGITSLIGSLTVTKSVERVMGDTFGYMGVGAYRIVSKGGSEEFLEGEGVSPITYREALDFKTLYSHSNNVSIWTTLSSLNSVTANSRSTNPNISIVATDQGRVLFTKSEIFNGRNFTPNEESDGSPVAISGAAVGEALFGEGGGVEESIYVAGRRYRVVALLKSRGDSFGGGVDSEVWIPIRSLLGHSLDWESNFSLGISIGESSSKEWLHEATATFRAVRGLRVEERDNFTLEGPDRLVEGFNEMFNYITTAAFLIGVVTLLAALVGLTNMMLVAVKERQREIGLKRALGAKRAVIKVEFLIESSLIALMGAVVGLLLGLLVGSLVALVLEIEFVAPWGWIGLSIVLYGFTTILFGSIPAKRAASLEPIEMLRIE